MRGGGTPKLDSEVEGSSRALDCVPSSGTGALSVKGMVATFSIVAFEPETKALGVAVQSKFLAVGAIVPWARAGVGAVATQAMANFNYGPRGLDLMSRGKTAEETVEALISSDDEREHRQLGVVDARAARRPLQGASASSGPGCGGEHYAAQGNILVGRETVEAMARPLRQPRGPRRAAPSCAGRRTGGWGDSRGKQSAALLVVKEGSGYGGNNDRLLDLRVDDHPERIELIRIRPTLYFGRPDLKTSWQWTVR